MIENIIIDKCSIDVCKDANATLKADGDSGYIIVNVFEESGIEHSDFDYSEMDSIYEPAEGHEIEFNLNDALNNGTELLKNILKKILEQESERTKEYQKGKERMVYGDYGNESCNDLPF